MVTGIVYFVVAGALVLPVTKSEGSTAGDVMDYFRDTYGLDYVLREMRLPSSSDLVGKLTKDEILAIVRRINKSK